MSEANHAIPEASSEQKDLRPAVLGQVVAIFVASAGSDDMKGLSAAILLRSTEDAYAACPMLCPHSA
jgi:hypothetical protein